MTLETDKAFWNAYEALSGEGACDTPGHEEYRRVFSEWIAAGKPADIRQFIRWKANEGPSESMH